MFSTIKQIGFLYWKIWTGLLRKKKECLGCCQPLFQNCWTGIKDQIPGRYSSGWVLSRVSQFETFLLCKSCCFFSPKLLKSYDWCLTEFVFWCPAESSRQRVLLNMHNLMENTTWVMMMVRLFWTSHSTEWCDSLNTQAFFLWLRW